MVGIKAILSLPQARTVVWCYIFCWFDSLINSALPPWICQSREHQQANGVYPGCNYWAKRVRPGQDPYVRSRLRIGCRYGYVDLVYVCVCVHAQTSMKNREGERMVLGKSIREKRHWYERKEGDKGGRRKRERSRAMIGSKCDQK